MERKQQMADQVCFIFLLDNPTPFAPMNFFVCYCPNPAIKGKVEKFSTSNIQFMNEPHYIDKNKHQWLCVRKYQSEREKIDREDDLQSSCKIIDQLP